MKTPIVTRLDSVGSECVRYDLARFSPKTTRTPQGFLRAPAAFTRAGVFTYNRADGTTVRELRPEDEVFHADSLATLRGAPVVIDHPQEGMVTPSNAKKLSVGWASEQVTREDSVVSGELTVMDAEAISKVLNRDLVEISMGYRCRVDSTAGVDPQYGEYDQVQRNIRYNHVALGAAEWGRAGSDIGIRLDDKSAVQRTDSTALKNLVDQTSSLLNMDNYDLAKAAGIDEWALESILAGWDVPKKADLEKIANVLSLDIQTLIDLVPRVDKADKQTEIKMETISIGGVEIEVSKVAAQTIRAELARHDAKVQEISSDKEQLQGRLDAQVEELKAVKMQLEEAQDPERMDSKVNERLALVAAARKVLGEEAEIKGSAREIQEEVLRHDNKDLDLTEKSDEYVGARFDQYIESYKPAAPEGNKGQARKDAKSAQLGAGEGNKPDVDAARQRMREANANAWKGNLTTTQNA